MIVLRPARPEDAPAVAALVGGIVAGGGLTALADPPGQGSVQDWMGAAPGRSCWYVALDGAGEIAGVQWAGPHPDLAPETADIATFVRLDATRRGIGTRLFGATRAACHALGYRWINATVRADNGGMLAFYARMGFQTWKTDPYARVPNGLVTGTVSMRLPI